MKHISEVKNQTWYQHMIEDVDVIYSQRIKESRQSIVLAYHEIGERINKETINARVTELVQRVAVDIRMSERSVWYAIKIFQAWPDASKIPDGDNVSLRKLIKRLERPKGKENEECGHEMGHRIIKICKGCGKEIK